MKTKASKILLVLWLTILAGAVIWAGQDLWKLGDLKDEDTIEQVRITRQFEDMVIDLSFDVVYLENHPVILTQQNNPYVLTPIPNCDETWLQYRDNLYILNIKKQTIEKASIEHSDQLDQLFEQQIKNLGLTCKNDSDVNAP